MPPAPSSASENHQGLCRAVGHSCEEEGDRGCAPCPSRGDLGSAFCSRTLEGHGLSLCGLCFPQALVWMGPETHVGIDGRFAGLFAARRTLCVWPALLGSRGAGAVTFPSPRSLICHCHACPTWRSVHAISRAPRWRLSPCSDRCESSVGFGASQGPVCQTPGSARLAACEPTRKDLRSGEAREHLARGSSLQRDLEAGRASLVNQEWTWRPPPKITNDGF